MHERSMIKTTVADEGVHDLEGSWFVGGVMVEDLSEKSESIGLVFWEENGREEV
jgi:hypothetical protein